MLLLFNDTTRVGTGCPKIDVFFFLVFVPLNRHPSFVFGINKGVGEIVFVYRKIGHNKILVELKLK